MVQVENTTFNMGLGFLFLIFLVLIVLSITQESTLENLSAPLFNQSNQYRPTPLFQGDGWDGNRFVGVFAQQSGGFRKRVQKIKKKIHELGQETLGLGSTENLSTEQMREALGIICGNSIFHGVEPSELVNSLQNGTITELLREVGRSEVRDSWSNDIWAALLCTEDFSTNNLRMLKSIDKHGVLQDVTVHKVRQVMEDWRKEMIARYVRRQVLQTTYKFSVNIFVTLNYTWLLRIFFLVSSQGFWC